MVDEVRTAVRSLAGEPSLVIAVILLIALGVGLNTAIFSVVNAALLNAVPYPEPSQLVMIRGRDLSRGWDDLDVPALGFEAIRARDSSFQAIGAWRPEVVNVADSEHRPEQINAALATENLFLLLGAWPQIGTSFSITEDHPSPRSSQLVLSHGFWKRRFGSDPAVLGKTLKVDGRERVITGILPGDFRFPESVEMWLPMFLSDLNERDGLRLLGRMRQGASLQRAEEEVKAIAAQLVEQRPEIFENWSVHLVRLNQRLIDNLRPTLLALHLAVGLVLLIGCFNAAGLLLVRAHKLRVGTAIRIALGASRIQIWKPLLAEGILLGLASAGLGLFLALWGIRFLEKQLSAQLQHVNHLEIDAIVLIFAIGLSLATTVLASLTPTLESFKVDVAATLKGGLGKAFAARRRLWMRNLLTGGQISLAFVLLSGAALMIDTLLRLQSVDAGFRPQGLLFLELDLPQYKYPEAEQQVAFYDNLLEKLRALPGVESASATSHAPLLGNMTLYLSIEGMKSDEPEMAYARAVWSGYLETMGIPVARGRGIGRDDLLAGRPGVAVVNQTMARRYWPEENPLGRSIRVGGQHFEVIGIAGDIRHRDLKSRSGPAFYIPFTRFPRAKAFVVVRSADSSQQLIARLQEQVWAVDAEQPVVRLETMSRHLRESFSDTHSYTLLMGAFAALAVSLALVGFYTTIAALQKQRTREFGIRMALGAARQAVLTMVLTRAAVLALCGLLAGWIAALGLTRYLSSWLFETSPTDFGILAAISALLFGLAILASALPALRATRIDPAFVLRHP